MVPRVNDLHFDHGYDLGWWALLGLGGFSGNVGRTDQADGENQERQKQIKETSPL
jgi:hypothetical protein